MPSGLYRQACKWHTDMCADKTATHIRINLTEHFRMRIEDMLHFTEDTPMGLNTGKVFCLISYARHANQN